MPKFVLIDPSLERPGGHHYDYAHHTLCAASELGLDTYAATNRKFAAHVDAMPVACECEPVFQHHAYSRYSDLWGVRRLLGRRSGPLGSSPDNRGKTLHDSLLARFSWDLVQRRLGRQKRIRRFAKTCAKLFQNWPLEEGDHVFAPSASELELYGLAQLLQRSAAASQATWHLQFHFDLFDGRLHTETQHSEHIDRMARHFQAATRHIQHTDVHFYNTTQPLTWQYNRMQAVFGVCEGTSKTSDEPKTNPPRFESLAYPINPAFRMPRTEPLSKKQPGPWRVLCAGEPRDEKGYSHLPEILQPLGGIRIGDRAVKLLVQSRLVEAASHAIGKERERTIETSPPAGLFEQIPYPLTARSYTELIRSADVGLFLYDSRSYFTRRAGVLGETLAAGVPVIVPAGCWLADQIAEPTFAHLEKLRETLPLVGETPAGAFRVGGFAAGRKEGLAVPTSAGILLVRFRRGDSPSSHAYVRLNLHQFSQCGAPVGSSETIIGQREQGGDVLSAFRLDPAADRLSLRWSNAYEDLPLPIADARFEYLAETNPANPTPLGNVGLVSTEPARTDDVLRELLTHYEHYRQSARRFSQEWFQRHDPKRTVMQLLDRGQSPWGRQPTTEYTADEEPLDPASKFATHPSFASTPAFVNSDH